MSPPIFCPFLQKFNMLVSFLLLSFISHQKHIPCTPIPPRLSLLHVSFGAKIDLRLQKSKWLFPYFQYKIKIFHHTLSRGASHSNKDNNSWMLIRSGAWKGESPCIKQEFEEGFYFWKVRFSIRFSLSLTLVIA